MNKKIILSLAIIGAVAAVAVGGTVAYFSDTETVSGNTFSAGTIDIAIDGENPWTKNYQVGDLKPGETGYINFDITNEGTNPVNVSKTLTSIDGSGGVENYFCEYLNGDTSSEPECVRETDLLGRKDDVASQIIYDLSVEVYDEQDTLIWWQAIYTDEDGMSITQVYGDDGGNYVNLGMIPVGGHMFVTQSYHFNPDAGNEYQGDGLSFDITIKGDQMAQEDGYTTVALENKSGAPEWDILLGDGIEGTLNYQTKGPEFKYNFTGKVKTTGDYTLLYVGSTNDYPCVGSILLGAGNFTAGVNGSLSGQVATGDIVSGKIWLIPSASYSGGVMTSWPEADILFETGLINYDEN